MCVLCVYGEGLVAPSILDVKRGVKVWETRDADGYPSEDFYAANRRALQVWRVRLC